LNSKSGYPEKTAAVKELHNLVKTKCLLLRDLPFITRISKYYDLTLFDNIISGSSKTSSKYTNFRDNKSSENQFNYKNTIEDNSRLMDTINGSNNYDDELMESLQAQIPKQDTLNGKYNEAMTNDEDIDKLISPGHWETIRKLRELQD
jgi:hypothetical protein